MVHLDVEKDMYYDISLIIFIKHRDNIKKYVMYINCAHSKGIRFIRDELKIFCKNQYSFASRQYF